MTWLVWRQHRKQLLFGAAALVVLGAFFIYTGRPIHDRFERAGLPGCLPAAREAPVVIDLGAQPGTPGPAPTLPEGVDKPPEPTTPEVDDAALADARCVQEARAFFSDYQNVIFVGLLLLVLPMLVGMFWGAPLVARELEAGTHRLVWTQGTSRLRWATTKFGLVTLAVLVMTAIYAGMLTWWITPVIETSGQRFSYIFFDIHGIVVFGYVLFALALGLFAGAVTGRLLSAMAATVVGFIGVRLVVMLAARGHYLPAETRRTPELATGYPTMRNDLSGDWIVATGTGFDRDRAYEVLTIHPIRQFWAFQSIETAIFVALALSLLIGAIYWTRRRMT
jgi:ABC-type transport system involved in multi-copper enzyme maturation permease subunit